LLIYTVQFHLSRYYILYSLLVKSWFST